MGSLSTWESILRLALSALFGGVIGLEREIRLKGAGIRTHLIVSFASCMMTMVSKYGFADMVELATVKLDPSRIAAGLVTAIGFLGAGAITAHRRSLTGMTTAAGLWATVGIGMSSSRLRTGPRRWTASSGSCPGWGWRLAPPSTSGPGACCRWSFSWTDGMSTPGKSWARFCPRF